MSGVHQMKYSFFCHILVWTWTMAEPNQKTRLSSFSGNPLPPEFAKFDKPFGFEQHILNRFLFVVSHVELVYFIFFLVPFGYVPKTALLLALGYAYWTALGITVGAHRYWSHRSFKAKKPLQILLMLMQTATVQYPLFKWCRDHRVHHKYSDTDADPHNATRGFLFSHITWLLLPKNKQVQEKLKTVNVSDLAKDPIVRFQSKYYFQLVFLLHILLPMTVCYILFPEMSLMHIHALNTFRSCFTLHLAAMVNSVAHLWGNKPYDKSIRPTENKAVSFFTTGEGWHNYHHTFPWDYKAAEFGYECNLSTLVVNFFAWIGWAYDLKTVSRQRIEERVNKTGDGSHVHALHNNNENGKTKRVTNEILPEHCWGWGDEQLNKQDLEITEVLYASLY